MSREFVSTKNAVGRTRTYRFEHCGPFTVWANPMEAKRSKPARDRMVVFDYSGPERLPLLAGPNKRMSGGNAFINAGYGLAAREMARMLNHRRHQIINLDPGLGAEGDLSGGGKGTDCRDGHMPSADPARPGIIREPILIFEGHDLSVFDTIAHAESYIEPWDADDKIYEGFDAEGRLLDVSSGDIEVAGRWTKRMSMRRWTVIRSTDQMGAADLAQRLRRYVEVVGVDRFGVAPHDLAERPLHRLVDLVSDFERR